MKKGILRTALLAPCVLSASLLGAFTAAKAETLPISPAPVAEGLLPGKEFCRVYRIKAKKKGAYHVQVGRLMVNDAGNDLMGVEVIHFYLPKDSGKMVAIDDKYDAVDLRGAKAALLPAQKKRKLKAKLAILQAARETYKICKQNNAQPTTPREFLVNSSGVVIEFTHK
jgi:hypothetical protein